MSIMRRKQHKFKHLEHAKKYSKPKFWKTRKFIERYDFVPMGEVDYKNFRMDYWIEDEGRNEYGDATHWLIYLEPSHRFRVRERAGSISRYDWMINVFACYADGTSPSESSVNLIFGHKKHHDMMMEYERRLSQMKVDEFWETVDEPMEKLRDRGDNRENE